MRENNLFETLTSLWEIKVVKRCQYQNLPVGGIDIESLQNGLLEVCYVPTTSADLPRVSFFFSFLFLLLQALAVLMKQTRQAVRTVKQSIFLDVYGWRPIYIRCLWLIPFNSFFLSFWRWKRILKDSGASEGSSCDFRGWKKLQVKSYMLQVTSWKLQARICNLQVTSWKLQVESYKLKVTSWKLQVESYKLKVTSCKLQVASCKLQVASCKLQVASCKLQVESYMLLVSNYKLEDEIYQWQFTSSVFVP
jgi:hypothetical protein